MAFSARIGVIAAALLPIGLMGCKSSPSSMQEGKIDAHVADATIVDAKIPDVAPNLDVTAMLPFDALAHRDGGIPDVIRGEPPPRPTTNFCGLPGAVVWSNGLPTVVPGGAASLPDLTWLHVPDGFCTHYFGTVPETRQLRFSPSGDLFVASPERPAAGGAPAGLGAIVVLPEDKQTGVAESPVTYLPSLVTTQGMLFYNGYFYYQHDTQTIWKTPYSNGDRVAASPGEQVVDINVYVSTDHWAKTLDVDDNGNIFVTNGGDEGQVCSGAELTTMPPFTGGVLRIDGTPNGAQVAGGLRNAYSIRCAKGTGMCFGLELARDFAPELGSREKLFPIRQGDNWGFPCCATANTPYADYTDPLPNCSAVSAEEDSFVIDHTPFGLDFEEGFWSGTWKYRAFVGLHGYFVSWYGARVLAISTNAAGWPDTAQETDAGTTTMMDFATGWDDGKQDHGRPAAVQFGPDGRLYVGDDMLGVIVWIAPVTAGM